MDWVASSKLSRETGPFGRDFSRSWRFVFDMTGAQLEGNIFVGNFGAASAGGGGLLRVRSLAVGIAAGSSGSGGGAFGAPAEHAEIVGNDLEAGALLAFFILPFAGLDASLDENQRASLEVLLGDFGLLAPDDNLVPLRALLPLTVAVLVRLVGGEREVRDGLAASGVARFGIAAQAADKNHFVNGHRQVLPGVRTIA